MQAQDDSPASTAVTESDAPHSDQFLILVVGFSIGLLIAGIFLLYIVLGEAHLLT